MRIRLNRLRVFQGFRPKFHPTKLQASKRIGQIEDIFKTEQKALAAYAIGSGLTLGREFDEKCNSPDYRTAFQHDIDRLIWSNAFQRLAGKTQVFGNIGNDHTRTRQSHSYTVARIAREICQALRLNQDLAEAIALAHDLGHPPFGHCGQDVLNECMRDHGGFEHNAHTLRLVTVLEQRYPTFPGLNLTYEVRDGICKHFRRQPVLDKKNLTLNGNFSLEAAVVNIADQIAYSHHDLEDGFRLGFISAVDLKEHVPLWNEMFTRTERDFPSIDNRLKILHTIGQMIKALVDDLIVSTAQNLQKQSIKVHSDVIGKAQDLVVFSPGIKKANGQLRAFLMKNLYHHKSKLQWEGEAKKILRELFDYLVQHEDTYRQMDTRPSVPNDLHRSVCDFIAGMTDGFAKQTHKAIQAGL